MALIELCSESDLDHNEAKLFSEWYIEKKIKKLNQKRFKKSYYKVIKNLVKKINLKNDTFVHRDLHISNLMMVENKILLFL